MVTVQVPATTANVGSGFDSIGIALQLYNTLSAEETQSGLSIEIQDETGAFLPRDERNLVYRAMQTLFDRAGYQPKGLHLVQRNGIPVTRGLGSSSAGIVGGMMAANALCGSPFSKEELINMAAEMEGHPDNTTPAITGGMAVAVQGRNGVSSLTLPVDGEKLIFALMIPKFTLRTKKARSVLPYRVTHRDAVFNTGRAALLAATFATGQYEHLAVAMDDRLHQPYRKRLIGGASTILYNSRSFGALGSYISGAGPTIVALLRRGEEEAFTAKMQDFLEKNLPVWAVHIVPPDSEGAKFL